MSTRDQTLWISAKQIAEFAAGRTDAYRLGSGADGYVERLGADAMVCFRTDAARDRLLKGLTRFDWRPNRVFGRYLAVQAQGRDSPTLLDGDSSLPMQTVVQEAGVRYGLDFEAGYSHGLFLDQRANRAWLRRKAPQRLLNTFAYTCSFSVVAALAGAETVSVDLSKKSLERGRANFALNGVDLGDGHRLLADDAIDVLARLARRGELFDAIVLDPPTFSRGNKGRVWKVEEHFHALLGAALQVAAPGANILLSTNCSAIDGEWLEEMARACLSQAGRAGSFHREADLPDFPPGHSATTRWLRTKA